MADQLSPVDLEKMQKSVADMTDLARNLRSEFKKIKDTSGLLSYDFTSLTNSGHLLNKLSEKYLFSQQATAALSEKINELKSKSGYLDESSLKFKKDELDLQKNIIKEQIKQIGLNNNLSVITKQRAIEDLRLKETLAQAELDHLNTLNLKQNKIVEELTKQKNEAEKVFENIQLIRDGSVDTSTAMRSIRGSFTYLAGRSGLIVKDLGKMGEYISDGVTAGKLLADILQKGYENFKAFDKAAVSVRSHLGVLPGQANNLELLIKRVGIDTMHLGATFEDVGKSINAITDEFTSLVAEDKDLLTTTTALAKQFGVSEAISAKFLKTLGGISDKSVSAQRSMMGFAQKMAQASGVPLGKIMEDVANASDDVRVYVGSSAISMIKAATAARMMGIDLNKAAASAEKLLQFESSVSAELKASALLGQNISFNYARQLSFNKDIIGANKEILKIAKQVNFNQLNPIQQKAFAEAAGKSVAELQDMFQQEKNMELVANSTNKHVKNRYEEYKKLMEMKELEAKDEGKNAEREFLKRANQEKLLQIQNKFNQLMSELAEPVMEISEVLLDIAIAIMPTFINGIKMGIALFKPLGMTISYLGNKLGLWITHMETFIGPLLRSQKILLSIGKFLLPVAGFLVKWLNPIGWIISGFLVIRNLIRDVKRMFDEGATWGDVISKGLKLIAKAIIEAFLPFDKVKEKLDEWFFGKSPSKAGKLIAKGFSSIAPELQESLITPISDAYKNIESMSPPDISIESKEVKRLGSVTDNTLLNTIQSGNQQLVAKMDQLINMMANGKIAVYLDGQLVNKQLATTTFRSGGYGQSTTLA